MRGPVGLFAQPDTTPEWETFIHTDEHGAIDVHIERALLAPPHVKNAELLVSIEGYGRFRLHLPS